MVALAAAVSVLIAVALLSAALRPDIVPPAGVTLGILTPKYRKWERRIKWIYVAMWLPVAVAIWWPLRMLSNWCAEVLPAAQHRITPGALYWLLPAFFLSLAFSVLPATWFAKKWLGSDFAEYGAYLQLKQGRDVARVNRYACWMVGTIAAVAVFLGLNWYVLVTSDAIVIKRFLAVSESIYPYSEVHTIQTAPRLVAPNGNIVQRREFLVKFRNGESWSTHNAPAILREPQKRAIIDAIAERSGVKIEEIAEFPRSAL